MKTAAIICEYNPFHNGHKYHLDQVKKQTDANYVIALMSGNYVQRGTPAIIEKHARAKCALLSGADLVIELPVWFACGSAPYFATGAITLLNHLGIVDYLGFGSECSDVALLREIAAFLCRESDQIDCAVTTYMNEGHSYPKARQLALESFDCSPEYINVLQSPNNILAIEYLKAMITTGSTITPIATKRIGSAHHDTGMSETYSSATSIRETLETKDELDAILSQVPENLHQFMANQHHKTYPMYADDFSSLLKHQLISTTDLSKYWDVSSDFASMMAKVYNPTFTYTQFISACKNKNWTWARISRNLLHILLGMTEGHRQIVQDLDYKLYYQILGFQRNATPVIKQLKDCATIPMVRHCRPLEDSLSNEVQELLFIEMHANHLYQIIVGDKFNHTEKTNQIIV